MDQIAIHHKIGPHRRSDCHLARRNACDSVDQPIAFPQVESWIEPERHQVDSGPDISGANRHREFGAIGVCADRAAHSRHFDHAIQMIAFDPVLQFARRVALVFADFEVHDNDDFWADYGGLRVRLRE